MRLIFHEKKKAFIDAAGENILANVTIRPSATGSIKQEGVPEQFRHKDFIDLGEIASPVHFSKTDFSGKPIGKYTSDGNYDIGFAPEKYKLIQDLAENLLKDISLRKLISENFLAEHIYSWAIGIRQKKIDIVSLSDFLIRKADQTVLEHYYYIPILFLDSFASFDVGHVHFTYLEEEYIRRLAEKVSQDSREHYLKEMLRYKPFLFGRRTLIAEEQKGKEIASKNICLSIDVLKMLSPTVEEPDFAIYFDVDFRNAHQAKNEILVQPVNVEKSFNFSQQINMVPKPFYLGYPEHQALGRIGLAKINQFLIRTADEQSELEALIYIAIKNFAKAIGNHDHHERIVGIFTVLESLLLPNESLPVVDSVAKYLPRLITRDFEERKSIVAAIKSLYSIRSAMVHHGRRKEFEKKQLMILQLSGRNLILQLMEISIHLKTKSEILRQLDDNILPS